MAGTLVGALYATLSLNTMGFTKGVAGAQSRLQAFTKVTGKVGSTLTRGVTLPVIAIGAASAKMAADFDQSMRNVNSIAQLSESQFKDMSNAVLNMARDVGKAPKDLADGLYDIASSGFKGAAGLKVLKVSARAAKAGMTSTAISVKAVTGVLNAYGWSAKSAGRVGDVLFKTVDRGVITFEELAQNLGDVTSTAAALGISIEEVGGAIAAFTKAGVTGAETTTALNRVMMAFIKPSKDMAKFIKASGYESGQAMIKQLGLAKTMDLMGKATKGNVTALAKLFPEVRGIKGALIAVAGGGKAFAREMKAVEGASGALGRALSQQEKGALARYERAMARLQVAAIKIGSQLLPAFAGVAEGVGKAADAFAKLDVGTQQAIIWGALIVAVLGPVLSIITKVTSVAAGFATALNAIGIAATTGSVLGVGALFAVIAGGAFLLYRNVKLLADNWPWSLNVTSNAAGQFSAAGNKARYARLQIGMLKDAEADYAAAQGAIAAARKQHAAAERVMVAAETSLFGIRRKYGSTSGPALAAEGRLAAAQRIHNAAVDKLNSAYGRKVAASVRASSANTRLYQSGVKLGPMQNRNARTADFMAERTHDAAVQTARSVGPVFRLTDALDGLSRKWDAAAQAAWNYYRKASNAAKIGAPRGGRSIGFQAGGWASGPVITGEKGPELVFPHDVSMFFKRVGIPMAAPAPAAASAGGDTIINIANLNLPGVRDSQGFMTDMQAIGLRTKLLRGR